MTDLISREAAISELTLRRSLLGAQNVVTDVDRDLSVYAICIDALRALPTQAPATPCLCTLIEQDDDCPIGQPSLLCGVCSGTGNTTPDKVQALAAEMLRIASDLGEPQDPFAAWENLQGGAAQAPAVGVADVDAVIDIVLQEVHGPLWRAILSSEDCLNRVCTDKTPESCICAPKIDRIESHARSQAKARILAAIEPAQGGEA